MSRSKLNQTLDKLYAAESIDIPFGKPITDKVIIDRKTLTAYPLSEEEIQFAEANVTHDGENCQLCEEVENG
jgi:hypothetical protein